MPPIEGPFTTPVGRVCADTSAAKQARAAAVTNFRFMRSSAERRTIDYIVQPDGVTVYGPAMVTSGAGSALTLGTAPVLTGTDRRKIADLPDLTGMRTGSSRAA
jgi:hypothetical protein